MGLVRILLLCVNVIGRLVTLLTTPVFRWLYEGKPKMLPPVENPLLMKSAVELSQLIRQRKVKSVDLVTACITRIKQVNPRLNAVIAERYDAALAEAKEIDRVLDSGDVPEKFSETSAPFLGVPFTTKEAMGIVGMPNASGMLVRRNIRATKDADAVALMRQAGAIPLALTNVSELCMWYESSNLLYGRTNNAYHQGRMVGGSSGGEACLQSAAASPMGIGSDIGGSIRMPAFFNGIFGHKATTGVVSNAGQFPCAKSEAETFLSTGPLCRFACDLMPIFRLLVLPQHIDRLKLDQKVDVRRLRVFYMEDDGGGLLTSPVHRDVRNAVKQAADHMASIGCTVQRVALKRFKYSFQIWATKMGTSGDVSFCSLLGNNVAPVNPFKELLLWFLMRPRHTLPAIGLGIGEKVKGTPEQNARLRAMCDSLRQELHDLLQDDAIFFYPTHPLPAPYHHQPLTVMFNFAYTGIFNVLGLPATSAPMGLSRDTGVPVGVQIVASQYNDRLTLAVATELEKAFKGWVPPFAMK